MLDALSTAVGGLNRSIGVIANATSNIVNASSTGKLPNTDLSASAVTIQAAKVSYGANAQVIKTQQPMDKALLNMII